MSDKLLIFTGPSPKGWHRLETFIECPRKFANSFRTGPDGTEQPRKKDPAIPGVHDALIIGTLIHLGLAQYYTRIKETQDGNDPDAYYEPFDAIEIMIEAMEWSGHGYYETVTDVLNAYWHQYRNDKFKVYAVEELITGNVGGYDYSGRTDLIVEDSRGMIWIWDHKSCARFTKEKHMEYSLSGQMLGYKMLGKAAFGDKFAGIRLNYIQHGDTKRFVRQDADPMPGMDASFADLVVSVESSIATLTAEKPDISEWPKHPSYTHCHGRYKGSACPFLEDCKWKP